VWQDPRAWNSRSHSLRAGAVACTDAIPGTVSALLRCNLLAIHFDGFSLDSSSFPATSVARSWWKRVDSSRGSVLAIEKSSSSEQCAVSLTAQIDCTENKLSITSLHRSFLICFDLVAIVSARNADVPTPNPTFQFPFQILDIGFWRGFIVVPYVTIRRFALRLLSCSCILLLRPDLWRSQSAALGLTLNRNYVRPLKQITQRQFPFMLTAHSCMSRVNPLRSLLLRYAKTIA